MKTSTIVVGAGQGGLSISHELTRRGIDHIVLERGRIGEAWLRRWNNFCLVTPNWSMQLPGFSYDGDDPDGFLPRDEIAAFLTRYADSFGAPVRTGVEVTGVIRRDGGGFVVSSNAGTYECDRLVMSTGAYQKAFVPRGTDELPDSIKRVPLSDYTSGADLPGGDVLIIGSGQSGCQIAEELCEEGRNVTLACGKAPWAPRAVSGKDLFWWFVESGFLDAGVVDIPTEARLWANVLATGHHGGHDLHYRTLRAMGVTLVGHYSGAGDGQIRFADDLAASVAWGDAVYLKLREVVEAHAAKIGMQVDMPDPEPFDGTAPIELPAKRFGLVIFTGGFRPDYSSLLPWPEAFDADGFPYQTDGQSSVVEDLYFVGLHFLRKRKSALLIGVGEDAEVVAEAIAIG